MEFFTTGNQAVDTVGKMNISGNVTPHIWFKTILTQAGKPYYLAISILSDIVYWYRPTEIRDENSGFVLGWRKRFKEDMLQRSYDQFAEMYGESKKTVTRAIIALEELGVIKRVFRTIKSSSGTMLNNVLYIDLDPGRLYEITYPRVEGDDRKIPEKRRSPGDPENSFKADDQENRPADTPLDKSVQRVWTNLSGGCGQICREGLDKSVQTNTEITYKDYNNQSYQSYQNEKAVEEIDGMDEKKVYIELVKDNLEYEILEYDHEDMDIIDEIVELMADALTVPDEACIRVGGKDKPATLVKSQIMKITREHIEYVLLSLRRNTKKVKNIKAYLLTVLYNAPMTMRNYFQAEVNHDLYGECGKQEEDRRGENLPGNLGKLKSGRSPGDPENFDLIS